MVASKDFLLHVCKAEGDISLLKSVVKEKEELIKTIMKEKNRLIKTIMKEKNRLIKTIVDEKGQMIDELRNKCEDKDNQLMALNTRLLFST